MRTLTLLRTHGTTGRCVPRDPRPILLLPSLERPIQVKPLPVCDYKPVNEGTVDENGEKKDEKKDENANVNGVASMSMNGKSVEIDNTDAEGRLVLSGTQSFRVPSSWTDVSPSQTRSTTAARSSSLAPSLTSPRSPGMYASLCFDANHLTIRQRHGLLMR